MCHQNYEVYAGLIFYLFTKFLCCAFELFSQMQGKRHLTSIPERNEMEDEIKAMKWVSKKKHEVLKAKYKCLKKLFQIYDASVIGILPDPYGQEELPDEKKCRKKRSHRTKTDACAGTTEQCNGDTSDIEDKSTIASAVIRDLNIQCTCSTQIMSVQSTKTLTSTEKTASQKCMTDLKDEMSQDSKQTLMTSDRECECSQPFENNETKFANNVTCNNATFDRNVRFDNIVPYQPPHPMYLRNEKRKLTRFQSFLQRILGIKPEKTYRNYILPNGHVYASSDNNITFHHNMGRRRRRLRFRRLRRPKKINSEGALRDLRSPVILTYVQSVQKSCLMDTTPRQCPIMGCRMIFYGIINYNDHLNLCHFTERKYICHYCHEGFECEYDKYVHENEHIGITKLNLANISATSTSRQSSKKVCNTQTEPGLDVQEEKLKKIVSFFDKIVDNEQIITEIKKNRYSESNLQSLRRTTHQTESQIAATDTDDTATNCSSDKRTLSCGNLHRKPDKIKNVSVSEMTSKCVCAPVKCHICGEHFDYRRQLSLHVDLEHRVHDKFSKFHSCAGIVNAKAKRPPLQTVSSNDQEDEDMTSNSELGKPSSTDTQEITRRKSEESLSCDPSTNIIYYESTDTIGKKPSMITNIVQKVRSGITNYKWEPGTKIIRV